MKKRSFAVVSIILILVLALSGTLSGCSKKTGKTETEETQSEKKDKKDKSDKESDGSEKEDKNEKDDKKDKEKDQESGSKPAKDKTIEAPSMARKDFPVLDGSTATLPLGKMLYRLCTGVSDEKADEDISFTRTTNSYLRLMDGEADLLIVYEAGPKAKEDSRYEDLIMEPLGLDALVFLCNEGNPVESLTTKEIQSIYQGRTKNWKDVGGEDAPIVAFQRPENSGSQTLMEDLMMQGKSMADAPTEFRPSEMGELIDMVATYNNDGNALGYSVYYYANNMHKIPGLRFMAVDGVIPDNDTIQSGEYGYVNPFYVVMRGDEDEDSETAQLFHWLTGKDGQSLVEEMGYVSVTPGGKKLPSEYQKKAAVSDAFNDPKTLIVSGAEYDGNSGIVVFDHKFEVVARHPQVMMNSSVWLAPGSVIPADGEPVEVKEGSYSYMAERVGLFDYETGAWAVEPTYSSCGYNESGKGGPNFYMYSYDPDDYSKGFIDIYDADGNFESSYTFSSWEEESAITEDAVFYATMPYDYDNASNTSYSYISDDVYLESGDTYSGYEQRLIDHGQLIHKGEFAMVVPQHVDGNFGQFPTDLCFIHFREMDKTTYDMISDKTYVYRMGTGELLYEAETFGDQWWVAGDEYFYILRDESSYFRIKDTEGNVLASWQAPVYEWDYND